MDNLGDLLASRTPKEPAEATAIKQYIDEHFHVSSSITMQNDLLVITVSSGSLANTLRLQTLKIQAAAQTDKRLSFRIGKK